MLHRDSRARQKILPRRKWQILLPLFVAFILIATWQVVRADAPTPNPPLPSAKDVDFTANGPAPTMHGDPARGLAVFNANCGVCHGQQGIGGVPNPGSDDGTVPEVNPIDPGFLDDSKGDPGQFARDIDLFIQHGSRPSGDEPGLQMPAWGDKKLLTQDQIADVEAYVMQLNGVYWPDHWYPPAQVQMDAARSGNTITYTINVLNEGGSPLTQVQVRDTLPPGLSLISSDYLTNPGKVDGSTVEWMVGNIPQGGSAGPFKLVTALTGASVPVNVSQVTFAFCTYSGSCMPASQVSSQVLPAQPIVRPTAAPQVAVASPTTAPSTESPTVAPTMTPTSESTESATSTTETATTPTEVATPTEVQPTPTPVPPTATPAPAVQVPRPSGGNTTGGPALQLQGDAASGQTVFTSKCQGCHGPQATGGVANPGSNAGTVPALNPIAPALKNADPKTFAYNLDLFIEHGSTPAGTSPLVSMLPFGDKSMLTPQQIADVIAYIMSLNP